MKKYSNIFLILAAIFLSSCAISPIQFYPGEKLSDDKISIINSPYTGNGALIATRDVLTRIVVNEISFLKVDGKAWVADQVPVSVLPGTHVLTMRVKRYWNFPIGAGPGAFVERQTSSQSEVDISFISKAGHNYYVDGKIVNGNAIVWITDEKTGIIVAGHKE